MNEHHHITLFRGVVKPYISLSCGNKEEEMIKEKSVHFWSPAGLTVDASEFGKNTRVQGGEVEAVFVWQRQIAVLILISLCWSWDKQEVCGRFRLKSVITDSPDPCDLTMFSHNSQLPQTLERPERLHWLYFPALPETGQQQWQRWQRWRRWDRWTQARICDLAAAWATVGGEDGATVADGYPEHTLSTLVLYCCYGYGCGNYVAPVIAHTATPAAVANASRRPTLSEECQRTAPMSDFRGISVLFAPGLIKLLGEHTIALYHMLFLKVFFKCMY